MLETVEDYAKLSSEEGKLHKLQYFCFVVPQHRKHKVYTTDYKIHF